MQRFLRFLASAAGRWTRIGSGALLIVIGLLTPPVGWLVAAIGLAPLLAGALDLCLLAPLLGYSLSGPKLRLELGSPERAPLIGRPDEHAVP